MLRGWLFGVAVLLGVVFSFAGNAHSSLARDERWEEARKSLAEGKAADAKVMLDALIATYPEEADPYFVLGLAELRLRQPREAERAIRKALVLDPSHAQARTLLGWIELEILGNFEAAIKEYSAVITLRPDAPDAHVNLGAAYKKKGDLEKALASYDRALELRPGHVAALTNRGWVFADQERWEKARSDFELVLSTNPEDQAALQGLARVLEKRRDYAGAQQALGKLIGGSSNFVYWLEWGRVGLIRYYWVLLLVAIALFFRARLKKARMESHGG